MGLTEVLILIFFVELNQLLIFLHKVQLSTEQSNRFQPSIITIIITTIILEYYCKKFVHVLAPLINFSNSPCFFSILSTASLASHNSSGLPHVAVCTDLLETNHASYTCKTNRVCMYKSVLESHWKESKMGEQQHYPL